MKACAWKPERRFCQGAVYLVSSARLLEGEIDMTTIEFASETSRITTRPAVATRVLNALGNAFVAWKNRRAFYRLGEMSDAELADIGLTRADLHVAVAVPFGRDPTVKLRAIASERADTIEDLARYVA
jgi:uncharacterized protein YjiS (DUF1127 family)